MENNIILIENFDKKISMVEYAQIIVYPSNYSLLMMNLNSLLN